MSNCPHQKVLTVSNNSVTACTWVRLCQSWKVAVRWWDGRHRIAAAQLVLQEAVVGQVQVSAHVD